MNTPYRSLLLAGALLAVSSEAAAADPPKPTLADNIKKMVPSEILTLADDVKTITNIYSGLSKAVDVTKAVLALLGVSGFSNTEKAYFDQLNAHLDSVAASLDWRMSEQEKANRLQGMLADIMTAKQSIQLGQAINPMGPIAVNTSEYVSQSEAGIAFLRYYRSSVTGGRWNQVIASPSVNSKNYVYDWRVGVPHLMQLIALRLQAIALIDPNWLTDKVFRDELLSYRTTLMSHYNTMVSGVQCGEKKALVSPSRTDPQAYESFYGACADIYTGASVNIDAKLPVTLSYTRSGPVVDQAAIDDYEKTYMSPALADAKRQVMASLPLFELQSLIDALYLFANPIIGTDLAVADGTIPIAGSSNLCLTLAFPPVSVGARVMQTFLYPCAAASTQKFHFDRKTGQIKHTSSGQCLTIRGATSAPGATIFAGSCTTSVGTIPEETRFTYDAERGIIQSALDTVVDVKWGTIASGNTVWTWSRNYTAAQQWASPIPTNGLFDWL